MQAYHRFSAIRFVLSLWGVLLAATAGVRAAAPTSITVVSRAPGERTALAAAGAWTPEISADGRFIVFVSDAADLSPELPPRRGHFPHSQVFVRDLSTGGLECISRSTAGRVGNGNCSDPAISADGRYIAYTSSATNLIDGETQIGSEVYLCDRHAGTTTRVPLATQAGVSVSPQDLDLSADGRLLLFLSYQGAAVTGVPGSPGGLFSHDLAAGTTHLVSTDNQGTPLSVYSIYGIDLSGDGRFAAWVSPHPTLRSFTNIWLRDLQSGTSEIINTTSTGLLSTGNWQHPSLSHDGRTIVYLYDRDYYDGLLYVQRRSPDGARSIRVPCTGDEARVSADGGTVVFRTSRHPVTYADHSNPQVWRVDLATETFHLLSATSAGTPGTEPEYRLSSTFDIDWDALALSADGKRAAFAAKQDDLVGNDHNRRSDIFYRDMDRPAVERVSVTAAGAEGNTPAVSTSASVSANGRYVAFVSDARNLVPGDGNNVNDVFVADLQTHEIERVSVSSGGDEGEDASDLGYRPGTTPVISADGRFVVFRSLADNFAPAGATYLGYLYVRDRQLGVTTRVNYPGRNEPLGFATSWGISGDGRYVAIEAGEDQPIYLYETATYTTTIGSLTDRGSPVAGDCFSPALSADGRYLAFVTSAPGVVAGSRVTESQVYVRDRLAHRTERITRWKGGYGPVSLSADGRYVLFATDAAVLIGPGRRRENEIFLYDRSSGSLRQVSLDAQGKSFPGGASNPALSPDGRYAAFTAITHRLPPFNRELFSVFLRDWVTGQTVNLSTSPAGLPAPGHANSPIGASLSHQAAVVAFASSAPGLTGEAAEGECDVYARGLSPSRTISGKLVADSGVEFGHLRIGAGSERTLRIRNASSSEPLLVTLGNPDTPFALREPRTERLLAPGENWQVRLRFQADRVGLRTGTLAIHTSDPHRPLLRARLRGSGVFLP